MIEEKIFAVENKEYEQLDYTFVHSYYLSIGRSPAERCLEIVKMSKTIIYDKILEANFLRRTGILRSFNSVESSDPQVQKYSMPFFQHFGQGNFGKVGYNIVILVGKVGYTQLHPLGKVEQLPIVQSRSYATTQLPPQNHLKT